MKRVFSSHKEVAHVWAGGNQSTGRASRVFFEGTTIFSYGRHFPMARHYQTDDGQRVAFFNPARYGVSTGRHQNVTGSAWRGNGERVDLPPHLWPAEGTVVTRYDLEQVHKINERLHAERMADAAKETRQAQARAARARAKEKKVEAALALASFPERLATWRETGIDGAIRAASDAFLRIVGADVVTSKGARVSVRIARALLARRASGPLPRGEAVGVYNVTRDDGEIGLVIGCHTIPQSEIKWLAGALALLAE